MSDSYTKLWAACDVPFFGMSTHSFFKRNQQLVFFSAPGSFLLAWLFGREAIPEFQPKHDFLETEEERQEH